ncbi:MAG TPA: ABC transporter substrate-binding protein, partial [Candidatus Limnocylindria bacterium]|nr:ABC transporter substrate-binding protein [Candidatus Limnocylindria bacterium]
MFPNVLLIALGIFLSGLPFTCGAEASAPIKLQLKWKHQFQFAGYYAAVEQGYYRAAGLEVTLIEGGPHLDFGGLIASNAVQYTVGLPSMLLRRNEGLPVVALAAIYQHSPEVMLVREDSGITNPQQMAGRRLMMAVEDTPGVLAMFRNEGLPDGAIKRIPYDFNLERLINREIDGIGAYITDEPLYFKSRGVEVRAIRPQTYGVDFYGDCLFTSEQELIQHPEQVKAFVDASLKGWQYAMHHVDEMVDVIVQRYHPGKSREDLRYEAARMAELMFPDLIEAGHMNTGRWKHIADTYVRLGMLKPDYSLEGFIYDRNPPHDPSWARWTIGGVALFAIGLGSVTVYLMRMTRRIARAEHEAQEARVVLQSVLDAIPIG